MITTETDIPQVTGQQRQTILDQLGRMNRMAIDGLRPATPTWRGVELTCGYGYRVRIELAPNDTYTVQRILKRGAREFVKGEQTDVHWPELPEVAYRAGMFRDPSN